MASQWGLEQSETARLRAFLNHDNCSESRHSVETALSMGWQKISDIVAFIKGEVKKAIDKRKNDRKRLIEKQKIRQMNALKKVAVKKKGKVAKKTKAPAAAKAVKASAPKAAKATQKPKQVASKAKAVAQKGFMAKKPTPAKSTAKSASKYLSKLNKQRKHGENVTKAAGQAKVAYKASMASH